jgi:hypothetical protein
MGQPRLREHVAHIRFGGKSLDVTLAALGLAPDSDPDEVRRRVARYLETPEAQLLNHAVDRHENGNLTIRPPAVFG